MIWQIWEDQFGGHSLCQKNKFHTKSLVENFGEKLVNQFELAAESFTEPGSEWEFAKRMFRRWQSERMKEKGWIYLNERS